MMGYYIRFIHNRDLAIENIRTAATRTRCLLALLPILMQPNSYERFQAAGLSLPVNGVLISAQQLIEIKGDLPGQYKLQLRPSRRNSREVPVGTCVKNAYRYLRTGPNAASVLPPLPNGALPGANLTCKAMSAGVLLNGHKYRRDSVCEYVPRVQRRGNVEGVGGRDGSSTSHLIGVINNFFVLEFGSVPVQITLVSITPLRICARIRSMYVVERAEGLARPPSLDKIDEFVTSMQSNIHTIIHVDSITAKVHLAPHFEDADLMCALRMWAAR